MSQSETNKDKVLKNPYWPGSIVDPATISRFGLRPSDPNPWVPIIYENFLDEEQQTQIATRELDLNIKLMEYELETLKMISQMLKKKG
jgi:hypothetical protein